MRKDQHLPPIHFSDKSESFLVTGATGFIGQLLVRALLADGQQVTVLTRNAKKAAWIFDGKVRCVTSMHELSAEYRIDIIINLAGARILGWRWTAARKALLRHSRVGLTNELVAWIARAKQRPRVLLSASAIGYYGVQAHGDESVLNESSPPQAVFMSQLCQDWEQAAQAATQHGVQVKVMRFGLVLGNQGALPMMLMPIRLGLGGPLAGGGQWLSWIHVHDLLRAMAHLLNVSAPEPHAADAVDTFNFTAPQSVTQKQFSQIAAQVTHRPNFFPTPGFPMRCALGEQADLLLEGQRVAPLRLQQTGFTFMYPELEAALTSLE